MVRDVPPFWSTPGTINIGHSLKWNRPRITKVSPDTTCRSQLPRPCRSCPPFANSQNYTAYVEGWALYAESLGKDLGFYQDPYSDYGRLASELLRAVRLVLDTGVHYKHWTRQQMVAFFHEHTSEDEPDVQSETDRYIAVPGQALGYKLGQLAILRLREQAQKELGSRYDVRAFHDEILNGGALPLDVMDTRVQAWIAEQKAH